MRIRFGALLLAILLPSVVRAAVIANSQTEFSGAQGQNNWHYGYYNKTGDGNSTYDAATDFIQFLADGTTTLSATNFWNGSVWDWPVNGNPPWTTLNATGGHPNGSNHPSPAQPEDDDIHWVIRRYISEVDGYIKISGSTATTSASGDGTNERLYIDGALVMTKFNDGTTTPYVLETTVSSGSVIDFIIEPGAANNDGNDGSTFTAIIEVPEPGAFALLLPALSLFARRPRRR